jgi:hypothetical protein
LRSLQRLRTTSSSNCINRSESCAYDHSNMLEFSNMDPGRLRLGLGVSASASSAPGPRRFSAISLRALLALFVRSTSRCSFLLTKHIPGPASDSTYMHARTRTKKNKGDESTRAVIDRAHPNTSNKGTRATPSQPNRCNFYIVRCLPCYMSAYPESSSTDIREQ